MTEEKSKSDYRDDFVKHMLEKSKKEDKKPQPNTANVDPKQVELLLKKIQKGIQERK